MIASLARRVTVFHASLFRNVPIKAHVKGFVSTYAKHYGKRSKVHKLAWNGLTRLALRGALKTGTHRFLRGQSLYASASGIVLGKI